MGCRQIVWQHHTPPNLDGQWAPDCFPRLSSAFRASVAPDSLIIKIRLRLLRMILAVLKELYG